MGTLMFRGTVTVFSLVVFVIVDENVLKENERCHNPKAWKWSPDCREVGSAKDVYR